MPDITKQITLNNKTYTLELTNHFGVGNLSDLPINPIYHVYIDRYYQGRIHKKDGVWQALDDFKPSDKHPFVFTEKLFNRMGELIEGKEK